MPESYEIPWDMSKQKDPVRALRRAVTARAIQGEADPVWQPWRRGFPRAWGFSSSRCVFIHLSFLYGALPFSSPKQPLWECRSTSNSCFFTSHLCVCDFPVDDQNALSLNLFVFGDCASPTFLKSWQTQGTSAMVTLWKSLLMLLTFENLSGLYKEWNIRSLGQLEPISMYCPEKDRAVSRIRTGHTWESPGSLFQSWGWCCIFFPTCCPVDKKFSPGMAIRSAWICVGVWDPEEGGLCSLPQILSDCMVAIS